MNEFLFVNAYSLQILSDLIIFKSSGKFLIQQVNSQLKMFGVSRMIRTLLTILTFCLHFASKSHIKLNAFISSFDRVNILEQQVLS